MKKLIKKIGCRVLRFFYPHLSNTSELPRLIGLANSVTTINPISSSIYDSTIGENVNCSDIHHIYCSKIGAYSYLAENAIVNNTTIGKFCSIGPNLFCGWGIHPIHGISTAPMFYSTMKQNGMTLSELDKVVETKPIIIGNDVFIGANVTILDGVKIGDGAVIGAGAVVSKDIPPYSIAVGCPIQIEKYRFSPEQINKLLDIKWWDFEDDKLKEVERMFFDVNEFIGKYGV
jgi:acetyltransferase-like isoleucine patch superfamily enzyme